MKRNFMLLAIVGMLTVACDSSLSSSSSESSVSETSSSQPIEYDVESAIYFDRDNAYSFDISEYTYGTFIEHIDQCIYNGIWSEMILDRKFYQPIDTDVSQWKKGGLEDVVSISDRVYSPGYAAQINEGSSIYQRGIPLDNKIYNGYFYAFGSGQLRIIFTNSDETVATTINVDANDYVKFNYTMTSNYRNPKTTITIEVLTGTITVDALSLMPSDNYMGMRLDTLNQLRKLNAPLYRWPGGNFVSGYDFYDGIGPRDKRPTKRNLHYVGQLTDFADDGERLANDIMKIGNLGFYGAFEPNDFGIDEFIAMCRYLEAEPNLVLNSGLGTVEDAVNEIEYCNGINGLYADMRPQTEPYNIKYIAIGNEMNGSWQLGHMPRDEYIQKHNEIADAILEVDDSIIIIGVGDNHSTWSDAMISNASRNLDLISEHFYAERHEEDVAAHILSMKLQAEMRTENHRQIVGNTNIKISFDEYAYMNAEQASRLKDGLGVASALNVFIKNSDIIDIACYSSTVNATQGSITTTDYASLMQGNGYVLSLYSRYMQKRYQPLTFNKRQVNGYFEVAGTISPDGAILTLSVINASDQTVKLTSNQFGSVEKINYVTADYLESNNSEEKQELFEYEINNPVASLSFPRSLSIITIRL